MQASMIAWIVTYLLHSTILVLGAWLLERRWADRPERMSAVWKMALVGGLLTATVQTGLGIAPAAGRLELSPQLASAGPVMASSTTPAEVAPVLAEESSVVLAGERSERSWPPPDWPFDWDVRAADVSGAVVIEGDDASTVVIVPDADAPSAEPVLAPSLTVVETVESSPAPVLAMGIVATPSTASSAPAVIPEADGSWWATAGAWGLALLGAGSLLGLASVLVAFGALRQRLADRRMLSEGTLPVLLDGLRRRAGLSQRVPLMVATRVHVPMAVGVLRPEIVVPPKAAHELPVAHQESLLAHELAHVLRHDPAWRLVALLVERVFFFQPLNRLASRRIAQSAEYLCDDWAARHTRQPLALASCLTEIATWVARPGPVAATMSGPRSILGRRVQRLLQPGPAQTRPWWLSAALGVPLLGVVAMAPGVDARAAKPKRGAESTPVLIIDEDGRRHEVVAPAGGAVVVREHDGSLHLEALEDDEVRAMERADDEPSRRDARRAARQQQRAIDDARKQARKELRRAFREAKRRGEAGPSRSELEAILRRAHEVEEHDRHEGPRGSHRSHPRVAGHPDHLDLHVVGPDGVAVHERVPLEAEQLEALRIYEEARELEHIGPMLEELERELEEAGIDVVIRNHRGELAPEVHVVVPSEHLEAAREHARERARDHARAREHAHREVERAHREAERAHREHGKDEDEAKRHLEEQHERDVQRELERELDRAREELREAQRQLETLEIPRADGPGEAPEAPRAPKSHRAAPEAPRAPKSHRAAPEAPRAPKAPKAKRSEG